MKEAQSSFDVMASVRELRRMVGGHIDKVYHPTLDHLVLAVRLPGEGKAFLHFWVGRWLYLSDKSQEMPEPSDFAMMLRKRITNARISDIRQQGFDRIAVLSLEKEERFELVLELFGDGNVILIKDGVIVQPLTSHTWKHRDVRARKKFEFPPPVPDPAVLTGETLLEILRNSDTDLVRTIATKLNTGGRYSEEICLRAGVPKSMKAGEAHLSIAESILITILDFADEIEEGSKGYIVSRGGAAEDVVPVKMRTYEGWSTEEFDSYSTALESYVSRLPKKQEAKPRDETLELERLQRKLAQQEAAVTKLQDEARETQILGDQLFAEYAEVSNLLTKSKERMLASGKLEDLPGFVSFDPRSSILKIKLGTTQLKLDIKGTVESNARGYYEEAKRARRKLEGVLAALEAGRKEINEQSRHVAKASREVRKREPTKRFWFERFRWFISSEGAIVLGGKDAKSNDMLVKKHLSPGDRYAHADVHGAPSIVVKMKEGMTERTLREACEFAVATSKAWNAKIGSAAGYWVLPEQVSKTPQSGEYLAKGAFVIRGKRNYSDKLEIKLAVGEVEIDGERKIMCGPVESITSRSKRYVVIRPGETDRNDFAKKLAGVFDVPIEEIQSILPPGDVDVIEQVGLVIS